MKPDLDAIRARIGVAHREHPPCASEDVTTLLAYIDELESCTAHTTSWTIGETEWAQRIAHAEQRFADEYDARKAAERQVEELKARDDETFDGTDAAHPAWWRGNDAGVRGAVNAMHRMLADAISDSGAFGSEELNDLHARIKSMLAEIAELKSRIVTLEAMKP